MILILNYDIYSRIKNIPLKDVEWSIDLDITCREMQRASFVVIINYNENKFRIIKNRETGIDIIHPLSELNKEVKRMIDYCNNCNENTE